MYKIKIAGDVAARKQPVLIGSPDHVYPDLVFTTAFSSDIILPMNSVVLRTALINSKSLLEQFLKIKIVDLNAPVENATPVAKPKAEEPKKKPIKKEPGKLEWK